MTATTTAPDTLRAAPAAAPAVARRSATSWLRVAGIVVALLWTVVPLAWMLLSSFKSKADVTASTPQLFFTATLDNYRGLFTDGGTLGQTIVNSLVASLGSVVISVVLGTLAGYGLARTTTRRKDDLSFWVISVRMAPIAAVVLPLFLVFSWLGLVNTLPGLVLAYLSFNLPFSIWLMSAFFAQVPSSLEESAMVAGCSRWQTFWHVSLPLVKSGIVTTAVLCLVFAWNDYAFATIFSGPDTQTLPVAASQLVTSTGIDWGRMCAIGSIVVAPMVVAGLAVRRWLVTGLTLGAVTGE